MVENLSNTVILPIAGIVLTGVVSYELIHMIIERNNMSDDVFYKGSISNADKIRKRRLFTCGRDTATDKNGR